MPHHRLSIEEDPDYERLFWRFQRIAWLLLALVVLGGLLGLWGGGPLSGAVAAGSGLRLEYSRFARLGADTTLAWDLRPARGERAELRLSREYLRDVELQKIFPAVRSATPSGRWVAFRFDGPAGEPLLVTATLRPRRAGLLAGEAAAGSQEPLRFWQWVYP